MNFHTEEIKAVNKIQCMSIKRDILMRVLKKIIMEEARANEDLLRNNPIL